MSANIPFVEFSLTYLCQSRQASSSFVKTCCRFCCRHNLLKDVNDFPTSTVQISWQICVKFGTRELHTITLSSCEFPANRQWKTLHRKMIQSSPFILHFSSDFDKNNCTRHVHKNLSNCALRENRRRDIYILHKGGNKLVLLLYTLIALFVWNSAWEIRTKCCWLFVTFLRIEGRTFVVGPPYT